MRSSAINLKGYSLAAILIAPALFPVASVSAAVGDCAKITNVEDRLVCIEKKVDAVPLDIQAALQGVKVEQAAHPGICLFFKDRDQPAYSIFDCSHTPEQTFNIHKKADLTAYAPRQAWCA